LTSTATAAAFAFTPVEGSFRAGIAEEVLAGAKDKTGLGVPATAAQRVFFDGALRFPERLGQASEKAVSLPVSRRLVGPGRSGRQCQTHDQRQQTAHPIAHVATLSCNRSYRRAEKATMTGS
jgi:hypothetical protein